MNVVLRDEFRRLTLLVRALVLIGLVLAGLGVKAFVNGSVPPFKGRLAWIEQALHAMVGPKGPSLLWFCFAALCLAAARFFWRRAPKRPGQSWLW
jgi:hypothetical protein